MKKNRLLKLILIAFCLLLSGLAACMPSADSTPAQPTATGAPPTLTIPPPTPTSLPPTTTPTATPECPIPTEGTQLLKNEGYGYCFLYPDGYNRVDPLPYEVCLVPEGPAMACHTANLMLEVEDAAGRTADQAAEQLIAEVPDPETVERTDMTVGGEEAVMLDGLGGQSSNRRIVIVHADQLYELWFIPWDKIGDEFLRVETLYDTIIDSFTFVPIIPSPVPTEASQGTGG